MNVAIYEYDEEGEWKHSYFLLAFENNVNFRAVKKTIEESQKQQSQFIETQIKSFFDYWLEDVKVDE